MVVVIEPSHPHIENTVQYNENKMDGAEGIRIIEDGIRESVEDGHVLETRNVPEGSTLEDEFEKREVKHAKSRKSGPKIKNISFHMSVNPSENDTDVSEKQAVDIIDDIMEGLGYGNAPYRIYKHTDIERKHYHVVSVRIDEDGKKIDNAFEYMRLQRILKSLSEKYGFEFKDYQDKNEEEKAKKEEEETPVPIPISTNLESSDDTDDEDEKEMDEKDKKDKDEKKKPVPAFSRESPVPVLKQIAAAHDDIVANWSFTTFEQYQALMLRRYNVIAEIEKNNTDGNLVFFGFDGKKAITPQLYEKDDFERDDMLAAIRRKCAETKMSVKKQQRARLESLAEAAAERCKDFNEFRDLMKKKGVYVVLSWTRDGDLFGVTWIDRATRCAWKGSETKANLTWLKDTAKERGWELRQNHLEKVTWSRNNAPSRQQEPVIENGAAERTEKTSAGGRHLRMPNFRSGRPVSFGHGQTVDTGRGGKKKDDIWENELDKLDRNTKL